MTRPLKRSFSIKGHRTSISLEAPFWEALRQAAADEHTTVSALVAAIDARRGSAGLSSAVRVWVLHYVRGGAGKSEAPRALRGTR
jgi:predicted DNA-binding ribbon-helix-helix protein